MKNLKKIGIIGGADPAASCLLYQEIIAECLSRHDCLNGSDFPEIIIINFPFTRGMSAHEAQQAKRILCAELQLCVDKLVLCGADILALACNTLHLFVPYLNLYGKQFIHIVEAALEQIEQTSAQRLLLFATEASIKQKLYQHKTLEFVSPCQKDQREVDRIIERIHRGIYVLADVMSLNEIVEAVQVDGVVLGCTDLPVLYNRYPIALEIHIFDTIKILAKAIVGLK